MSCRKKSFQRESDGVIGRPCSSKDLTPLVILDEGTIGQHCYIKNMLPADLKYANEVSGDKGVFQQDDVNPHPDHLTQEWCRDNFPLLIDKDNWPPNNSDFNRLDDSIWDKSINVINWNKV